MTAVTEPSTSPVITERQSMYFPVIQSLTGSLDQRWVVAPSRCRDHWPCPKQHLQWARHRWQIQICLERPRGRFHSDLLSGRWPARVLTTRRSASCAGTDPCRRRTWPNIQIRLSRILLWILCCWVCGSLLTRLVQSRTSVLQESVVSTSRWIQASVRRTLLGSCRFQRHAVRRKRQGRCTVAALCTHLVVTAAIRVSADQWHLRQDLCIWASLAWNDCMSWCHCPGM